MSALRVPVQRAIVGAGAAATAAAAAHTASDANAEARAAPPMDANGTVEPVVISHPSKLSAQENQSWQVVEAGDSTIGPHAPGVTPIIPSEGALVQSTELLRTEIIRSPDGTPWTLPVDEVLADALAVTTELATTRPDAFRAITEAANRQIDRRQMLGHPLSHASLTSSYDVVDGVDGPSRRASLASTASPLPVSPTESDLFSVEREELILALRSENDLLRRENESLRGVDAATSAVTPPPRVVFARIEPVPSSTDGASTPPRVTVRLLSAAFRDALLQPPSGDVAHGAQAKNKETDRPAGRARPHDDAANAVIVGVTVIITALAIVLMRNPNAARMAAATAAMSVAALIGRQKPKQ